MAASRGSIFGLGRALPGESQLVLRVAFGAFVTHRALSALQPHTLAFAQAVDFCLAKLMETDGEAAVAADPSGGTGSGTSPLAAAAGLRQLVLHGRLGLLVGRSSLAEVLVQVVERLQDPELLAAALDVLQCLLSTEVSFDGDAVTAAIAVAANRAPEQPVLEAGGAVCWLPLPPKPCHRYLLQSSAGGYLFTMRPLHGAYSFILSP